MTSENSSHECRWARYELEIAIQATAESVWRALLEDIGQWWLPDFHMVGADSLISLDPQAGGKGLVEELPGGGSLQWYTVQMYQPDQHALWLVGQIGPDFGGPATSMLKLAIETTGKKTCLFRVSDALMGNVSDGQLNSLRSGWQQQFTDGLKAHVEGAS